MGYLNKHITMKIIIVILALLAVAMCAEVGTMTLNLQATFHYEDPFYSTHSPYCTGSREGNAMGYDGLDDYWGCMPETFGRENKCYQDYPNGTTATPMPIYVDYTDSAHPEGIVRCALVCSGAATGNCGPRAECMILPGIAQAQVGVCLYRKK